MDAGWLSTALVALDVIIVVALVPRIVIQRRDSAATLAWVTFIVLVPLAGALLFHLLGTRRLARRRTARVLARARLQPSTLRRREDDAGPTSGDVTLTLQARSLGVDMGEATPCNEVTVMHAGEDAFAALEASIASATDHVHLAYYIFHPDETGRRLLALLEARARAGVEVRLLVDAVGALDLRAADVAPLVAAGGRVARFLPVSLVARPFSVNFRNHRKIVVVDGREAFTGGMNVGDEYRGRSPEVGGFRDTHVHLRGPAVLRLQEVFVDDWHFTTGEACRSERYFPVATAAPGRCVVEVAASGPDATIEAIYRKLFIAITRADRRVWLTTPYFVPDRAMRLALCTAAGRGVDVRLLLPGSSDHALMLHAGRVHYDELLEAGVRVFEYQRGMLHAKTMVVDDVWCTIGSANMDTRSFALNWEANLIMVDRDLAARMADRFEHDLEAAVEVRAPLRRTRVERALQAASHVLSPLL